MPRQRGRMSADHSAGRRQGDAVPKHPTTATPNPRDPSSALPLGTAVTSNTTRSAPRAVAPRCSPGTSPAALLQPGAASHPDDARAPG